MTQTKEFTSGQRVEVLLPRPFDHGFDYRVPEGMAVGAGDYVTVPLGRQRLVGVVWGDGLGEVDAAKCKEIAAVHTHLEPMPECMQRFIDWSAAYYLSPKGMLLKMAIPLAEAITEPQVQTVYRVGAYGGKVSEVRQKILAAFVIPAKAGIHLSNSVCETETDPCLRRDDKLISREAVLEIASPAIVRSMVQMGQLVEQTRPMQAVPQAFRIGAAPVLSAEQQHAADTIGEKLDAGFSVTVLDGVTGSGKTEVYFDSIEKLLQQKEGQILVLLPEIALTVQWLQRCQARFGTQPVIWHSNLTTSQRRKNWQAIHSGAARLIVGARSALYLPYDDLRLIIVDEEHETSYKQDDNVPYQARDMAVARAHHEKVPVILVSATPSLETVYNIRQGKYEELKLHSRHGRHGFADIALVDLRNDKPERQCWLSPSLRTAMNEVMADGHQAMLFLNRRGYAPLVLCRHCGYRFQCPHCSAWMVQHKSPPSLQCHHCGHRQLQPESCPACGDKDQLVPCGPGVERVEEEVRALWPEMRVITLTSDDPKLGESITRILNREADIIIGTQLVAKGHHFPHLALVGVVDADLGLSGGDLRACEHTFQLLHQLAGRAGREDIAGKVLLQTCQPHHPVLQAMVRGDRKGFMELEIAQREQAAWPPFGRLAALLLDGPKEDMVTQAARKLVRNAPSQQGVRILGPAPAPLSRLKDQYRVRLLVKTTRQVNIQHYLRGWLSTVPIPKTVRLKVDIDPYYFL